MVVLKLVGLVYSESLLGMFRGKQLCYHLWFIGIVSIDYSQSKLQVLLYITSSDKSCIKKSYKYRQHS